MRERGQRHEDHTCENHRKASEEYPRQAEGVRTCWSLHLRLTDGFAARAKPQIRSEIPRTDPSAASTADVTRFLTSADLTALKQDNYLQRIGRRDNKTNKIINTIPSNIRILVDSLSVPKTNGTGPIMTRPPPLALPVPLADLSIAIRRASIPTVNPTKTSSNPMLKITLSGKSSSILTV